MSRTPPRAGFWGRSAPPGPDEIPASAPDAARTSPFTLRAVAGRVEEEVARLGPSPGAADIARLDSLVAGLADAVAVSLGDRGVRPAAVEIVARALARRLSEALLPMLARQAVAAAPSIDGSAPPGPRGAFLDAIRLLGETSRLVEVLDPDEIDGTEPPRRHLRNVVEALSGRAIAIAVTIEGAMGTGADHPDLRVIANGLLRIDVLEWGIAEAGGHAALESVRGAVGQTVVIALRRATDVIDAYVLDERLESLTEVAALFALLDDLGTVVDSALARSAPSGELPSPVAEALGAAADGFADSTLRLVRLCGTTIRGALAGARPHPWLPGLLRLMVRADRLGRRLADGDAPSPLALLPRDVADEIRGIARLMAEGRHAADGPEMRALAIGLLAQLDRNRPGTA